MVKASFDKNNGVRQNSITFNFNNRFLYINMDGIKLINSDWKFSRGPPIFESEKCDWTPKMLQRDVRQTDRCALKPRACRRKLLAVSSGGGHWVQLLRIRDAFEDSEVTFVTVHEQYRAQVPNGKFYLVNDANRRNKIGLLKAARRLTWIIWKERPDMVISTGAAP